MFGGRDVDLHVLAEQLEHRVEVAAPVQVVRPAAQIERLLPHLARSYVGWTADHDPCPQHIAARPARSRWLAASAAQARTYQVTERTDHKPDGCSAAECTLREAVIAANRHRGADTIVLPSRKRYELALASTGEDKAANGDLDITSGPLTIVHPGRGTATIDANRTDRVFDIGGATTTLDKLTHHRRLLEQERRRRRRRRHRRGRPRRRAADDPALADHPQPRALGRRQRRRDRLRQLAPGQG